MTGRAMTAAIAAAVVLALGCSEATGSDGSALAGTWDYDGSQEVPQGATLTGTVTLFGVGAGSVEGTFIIDEQLPGGTVRRLTGTAAGYVVSDSVAELNLFVDGAARRHFGRLRGDSVAGVWVGQVPSVPESGEFVLHRQSTGGG